MRFHVSHLYDVRIQDTYLLPIHDLSFVCIFSFAFTSRQSVHSRSTATTRVCSASRTIRVSSRILFSFHGFCLVGQVGQLLPQLQHVERRKARWRRWRGSGHRWSQATGPGLPVTRTASRSAWNPLFSCINPTQIHPLPLCSNIHEDAVSLSSNESDHSSLVDLTHQICAELSLFFLFACVQTYRDWIRRESTSRRSFETVLKDFGSLRVTFNSTSKALIV